MSSLADRLKALGVQVGAAKVGPPKSARAQSVDRHLGGETWQTERGEAYVVESRHAVGAVQGAVPLWGAKQLEMLAAWGGVPQVAALPPQAFAFLDTETTGLSGGSGTFAFMVGVGRFEGEGEGMVLRLAQFFLREPGEEPAQLAALEAFLAPCQAVVTFNGKAFDVPILNTRYALQNWPTPLQEPAHLDLLHLARRLWRGRLPSRRLGDLEIEILGMRRTEEEVPGWMVPELYLDYLRTGEAAPLKGVFYHNAMDILSLAALFTRVAGMLADPLRAVEHDLDLLAIGKLHEDLGHAAEARALYTHCLGRPLEKEAWLETAWRLAMIFKREGNLPAAMELWQVGAKGGKVEAFVELAKAYEHKLKQPAEALRWTEEALALIDSPGFPALERYRWRGELRKREGRLRRGLGGRVSHSPPT